MAFVHTFCFWFSVRLGSIIIGLITLAIAWLTYSCIELENSGNNGASAKQIKDFLAGTKVNIAPLRLISEEPNAFMTVNVVFFSCLSVSSILLIIAAYQCTVKMVYPFVLFYGFYVLFLTIALILLIFYLKNNDSGLGDLILYSNLGGFILLFYLYTWICVYSYKQIVQSVQKVVAKRIRIAARKNNESQVKKNNYVKQIKY